MKFEIEGKNYDVRFYRRKGTSKGENLITTACRVTVNDGRANLGMGEGITEQSPKDNHVKKVGRKIAFLRALKDCSINKTERTAIWQEYRKQCHLV